jgi:hypothetical protein
VFSNYKEGTIGSVVLLSTGRNKNSLNSLCCKVRIKNARNRDTKCKTVYKIQDRQLSNLEQRMFLCK